MRQCFLGYYCKKGGSACGNAFFVMFNKTGKKRLRQRFSVFVLFSFKFVFSSIKYALVFVFFIPHLLGPGATRTRGRAGGRIGRRPGIQSSNYLSACRGEAAVRSCGMILLRRVYEVHVAPLCLVIAHCKL